MTLTTEERRLIDEAVAEGRVQKIPTGVSGLALQIMWDQQKGALRYVDEDAAKGRLVTYHKPRKNPDVAERREKVRRRFLMGMSSVEIAADLGIPANIVTADASRLGLRFRGRK